jgi:hypothetical protein
MITVESVMNFQLSLGHRPQKPHKILLASCDHNKAFFPRDIPAQGDQGKGETG